MANKKPNLDNDEGIDNNYRCYVYHKDKTGARRQIIIRYWGDPVNGALADMYGLYEEKGVAEIQGPGYCKGIRESRPFDVDLFNTLWNKFNEFDIIEGLESFILRFSKEQEVKEAVTAA